MRPLRYYPPGVNVFHVTSKCVDSQFLWRPSRQTTFIFAGALAATISKYKIGLYAVVVMANHFHLVVRAEKNELSAAMQFFKSQLATKLNPILGRRGVMSRERFRHQAVLDDASFVQVIHYVHANPVRAHCVERADQWPGLSSYAPLVGGKRCIEVAYFDEHAWREAGKPKRLSSFTRSVSVPLEQPQQWGGLSSLGLNAMRHAMRSKMEATERESALARQKSRTRLPSVESLMRLSPRARPNEAAPSAPSAPQPWAFGPVAAVRALRDAYKWVVESYQKASASFRATGILGTFPSGTFPPWVRGLPASLGSPAAPKN